MKHRSSLIILIIAVAALVQMSPVRAQVVDPSSLEGQIDNFAFLHYYGTGTYQVGEQRVIVVKAPPIITIKPMTNEEIGWMIRTAGVLAVEDFFDFLQPDLSKHRLFSVSAGVQMNMPVARYVAIKPYFDLGFGSDRDLEFESLIVGAGIESEIIFLPGRWRLALEPLLRIAVSRRFPELEVGGDYSEFILRGVARYPLPFEMLDGQPDAGVYVSAGHLFDSLTFVSEEGEFVPLRAIYEVGAIFGFQWPLPSIGPFQVPSFSVGFQFGQDFRGFTIGVGGDWLTPLPPGP